MEYESEILHRQIKNGLNAMIKSLHFQIMLKHPLSFYILQWNKINFEYFPRYLKATNSSHKTNLKEKYEEDVFFIML